MQRKIQLTSPILHQTVAALAFGPQGAQTGSVLPRGPEDVADAVVLVCAITSIYTDHNLILASSSSKHSIHGRMAPTSVKSIKTVRGTATPYLALLFTGQFLT